MANPTNSPEGYAKEVFWNTAQTIDTEIAAAAALADAAANPTTGTVGAAALLFNGTTWDRQRGDTTNGLDVDVTRVGGTVTVDSELPAAAALADAAANPTAPIAGAARLQFNGTTWDRVRGTTTVTELASAERTTTQTGSDTTNYNHRGIRVTLDMTVVGTGSVTLTIEAKDSTSGKYSTLLAGAAVTTNSTNVYKVYPGLTAAANATASDVLPRVFRLVITANNANAATYSVGYDLLV